MKGLLRFTQLYFIPTGILRASNLNEIFFNLLELRYSNFQVLLKYIILVDYFISLYKKLDKFGT